MALLSRMPHVGRALVRYVVSTVARAPPPLGLTSGITAQPQVGPPRPAVMPEVGPPEVPVMARGGADVSVTSYNWLQLVTTSYN